MLDTTTIRQDFEILKSPKAPVYLDNACMTLKPRQVVEAMVKYYHEFPACAGRSNHQLSTKVTEAVELARHKVAKFIHSPSPEQIIFTRNTTEGINLVASGLAFEAGETILISDKEHNSNLVPWLKLARQKQLNVKPIPSKADNTFDLETYTKLLDSEVKLVAIVHTSNLDGVTNPIDQITKLAHQHGALVLVDAAQAAPHHLLDVQKSDVDFLSFSVHKLCGPTGMGILYGKKELLHQLDQFIVGGDTVADTFYDRYEPLEIPEKFEAGLGDYAGIIGTGAAIDYISDIGLEVIHEHQVRLNSIISQALADLPQVEIIGPSDSRLRSGIVSLKIAGDQVHLVAKMLSDSYGIMTRSGRHCVHSWFNHRHIEGSLRASLYLYNTPEEAEYFAAKLKEVLSVL